MSQIAEYIERQFSHAKEEDEARRSAAASSARGPFEAWISNRSDLARPLDRFGDHTRAGTPGHYKDSSVQLAWEAWQSSQNDQSPSVGATEKANDNP